MLGGPTALCYSAWRESGSVHCLQNRRESTMKSLERKREEKKKPAMTMKEKKAAKNAKKAAKNSLTMA
jgi:hypothetical protein